MGSLEPARASFYELNVSTLLKIIFIINYSIIFFKNKSKNIFRNAALALTTSIPIFKKHRLDHRQDKYIGKQHKPANAFQMNLNFT